MNHSSDNNLFLIRTANQCLEDAKLQPIPRNLYHGLLYENEVTILFAHRGIGKSIFAVQMANHIAKTDKVLYFDLELSDKQFEGRYSDNYQNHFRFEDNFHRVVFSRPATIPDGVDYDIYFMEQLKKAVDQTQAKIVIVDNMTMLISSDTDSARTALPLMKRLVDLKFDKGLTLLLLEHTRKTDDNNPIHSNQMQGSKHKSNLIDHEFSIGTSTKDKNLRYIKETKASRTGGELIYDSENVAVSEIIKENSFTRFSFIGYDHEKHHISQNDTDKETNKFFVSELRKEGKTIRDIATELAMSRSTVGRIVKELENEKKL